MRKEVQDILQDFFRDKKIADIQPVGGGCINETYVVSVQNILIEKFFVKINTIQNKDNFVQEKFNLEYLKNKSLLIVPDVAGIIETNSYVVLVMEYLEKSVENKEFEFLFGKGLAELHRNTEKFFGWFQNNYIGRLYQQNIQCAEWPEFFVTQRLEPLVRQCYNTSMLGKPDIRAFENLYTETESIFPNEPSALLHGDLWTGNRMNTTNGPAVFDAACYFGHREMDIAMLGLFGSVSQYFYEGYNSVYSLEKNFKQRTDICNLYPLLVHAILFGYSYIYDIKRIIKKFL